MYETNSPLLSAVFRGKIPIIWLLLRAGAHVDTVGGNSYTALVDSVELGYFGMSLLLLLCGADARRTFRIDCHKTTPFFRAWKKRRIFMVSLLAISASLHWVKDYLAEKSLCSLMVTV